MIPHNINFPAQRVGQTEKERPTWYANCIDYVVDAGVSYNDRKEAETQLAILHGDIPNQFYKKTLNPYNTANEKYTRFPATMRNFDIMSDIVRRYVSEYYKGINEFVVTACNPEIVLNKNAKLKAEVMILAVQAFQQELQNIMNQVVQQAQENGEQLSQEQINQQVQQQLPDVNEFVKNFNENYIDDESKQAQDVLDFIRTATKDDLIYLTAFFNFVTLGECYTYTDVRGESLIKECVPVIEAFPIPNSNYFVEDHDMFARKIMMSYQQIIDTFDEYLTQKDREFLETHYANSSANTKSTFMYNQYFESYPEYCEKFGKEEREFFKKQPVSVYADNTNLFEVWHVVWRGEVRRGILTYINELGFETQRVVDEGYKLNPLTGDVKIEWSYEPQVYEGYRIGNRYTAIYPIKAKPIAFNRNGKLPYNGIMEVLPMFGKFSIVKLITPYQIMRNIIIYHREMVIAKNKMLVLLIPESLIESNTEDKIYKMAADGVLIVDDTEDANSQKMAQIRMLNANLGDYITQLTNLAEAIKIAAREMVDMNMQRYGEIAQSAGAATTQEAVARSSMGSVIITQMFNLFRAKDYERDLDYAKLAYIDGLNTAFTNEQHNRTYISLDIDSYIMSAYGVYIKNDAKELDKINQLKQWAFSAAQNGDIDMAIAAIVGNNVTQIKSLVNKFMQIKRQHELDMQQAEQQLKMAELETKLAEIKAKGEEDRKTKELEYYYKMQLAYIDVDMSMLGADDGSAELNAAKQRLAENTAVSKEAMDREKLNIERTKLQTDMYNKAADRQVKREDMENKLKIARTNKNKYDK